MGLLSKAFANLIFYFSVFLFYFLKPFSSIFLGKKHVWIVCENGADAMDNGFHMYKYMRTVYPDKPVYYIISKASRDYENVAKYKNIIICGSIRHWLYFLGSEAILTTYNLSYLPVNNDRFTDFAKNHSVGFVVFLQHGIYQGDSLSVCKENTNYLYKENTNIMLFLCGTYPEMTFVRNTYHYRPKDVAYTGLARYDSLYQCKPERLVLIMPAWRSWLTGKGREAVAESEYVRKWQAFLTNPKLHNIASQYSVKIVFFPHPAMGDLGKSVFSKSMGRVFVADSRSYDLQSLIKKSMLLITDYSSVFFDFTYMLRPSVFYQFDKERFFKEHYIKSYFSYEMDGFGKVLCCENDVLNELSHLLSVNCVVSDTFREKVTCYFPFHDDKNCQRIYEEICIHLLLSDSHRKPITC